MDAAPSCPRLPPVIRALAAQYRRKARCLQSRRQCRGTCTACDIDLATVGVGHNRGPRINGADRCRNAARTSATCHILDLELHRLAPVPVAFARLQDNTAHAEKNHHQQKFLPALVTLRAHS